MLQAMTGTIGLVTDNTRSAKSQHVGNTTGP